MEDPNASFLKFPDQAVGIASDAKTATEPMFVTQFQGDKEIHIPVFTTGVPEPSEENKNAEPMDLVDEMNLKAVERVSLVSPSQKTALTDEGFVVREIPDTNPNEPFLQQINELAWEVSGFGNPDTQMAQIFGTHDRFARSFAPVNSVFKGFTFFTRPRLNLATWNIVGDDKFAALITDDNTSVSFAIRCMLDTQFCKEQKNAERVQQCKLINTADPFFCLLDRSLKSINGYVDPTLVTETSEGGFFSEDQTVVIGGDRLARTYDFNCMFRDYPGSPVVATFDYWCQYMANLTDGSMQQYADAIDANRIDYTVSIYRFLTDITGRYITRWAKCTGCYPISPPTGVPFNMNEGENMINAAKEFTVPFKVNRIEYDRPVIIKEFNMLVRRYAHSRIFNGLKIGAYAQVPQNNNVGIPYIRPTRRGYELLWLANLGNRNEVLVFNPTESVPDIYEDDGKTFII